MFPFIQPSLVLKKFVVHQDALPEGASAIEIIGRRGGLIGFLTTLMGLSARTHFTANPTEIRCEESSLFGRQLHIIPLARVASVAGGVARPIGLLFAAAIVFVLGIFAAANNDGSGVEVLICGGIGLALLISYILGKRFFITLHPDGGPSVGFRFQPSIIEGISVNIETSFQMLGVLRDLIVNNERRTAEHDRHTESSPQPHSHAAAPFSNVAQTPPETSANEMLARAKECYESGRVEEAIGYLKHILRQFPDTPAAQHARRSLERISDR